MQAQIAFDEEEARRAQEEEVQKAIETAATLQELKDQKDAAQTLLDSQIAQETFDAQMQWIIANDPIVKGQAAIIVDDENLTTEEKTAQLEAFIIKKYKTAALDDIFERIKESQQKGFKVGQSWKEQVKFMKVFLKSEAKWTDIN